MPATLPAPLQIRALGAMTCGLLSAFLALFYIGARIGFGVSLPAVAGVLGLAWCLISIPMTAHYFLASRRGELHWYQREGFWTLLLIVLTALAGQALLLSSGVGATALFVFGLIAFSWTVFLSLRGTSARFTVFTLLGVLGYAVWLAGVEWANGYLNPLFVENMILRGGDGHIDTLFFASLGNMLNTYGVASTGWDGVPYVAYHYGSSWLFAKWSNLVGLSVLDFYQVGAPVVLIPLFLRSILIFAAEVREKFFTGSQDSPRLIFAVLAGLIVCGTIGFLPPSALNSAAVWGAGPFLSESYILALAIALLGFSLVASLGTIWAVPAKFSETQSRWALGAFVLLFLPLLAAAVGLTKVSIMLLILAAGLYVILRFQFFRVRLFLVSAGLVVAASLYVYSLVVWPGASQGLQPLSFLRLAVPLTWWPSFLVLHLFWTWLFVYLRLNQESVQTLDDAIARVRSRRIVDVELALVFAAAGLLPGMLFNLRGDAYYFSDAQRWFSIGFLIANPALLLRLWGSRPHSGEAPIRTGSFRGVGFNRLVAGALIVLGATTVLLTAASWGGRAVRSNFATRRALQDIAATRPTNSLANEMVHLATHPGSWFNGGVDAVVRSQLRPLADSAAFSHALQAQKRHSVVMALLAVGKVPVEERRASLLYIDPALDVYWNFLPLRSACQFSVMIGPALAGTALLDGVPAGCHLDGFYGTEAYREKPQKAKLPSESSGLLCDRARKLGYARVIELQPGDVSGVRIVRFACTG